MLILSRRRVLVTSLSLAAVGGCTSPPHPTYPDIRFTDRLPLKLNVANVEVVTTYQMPLRAPNVEQLFPVWPQRAVENWAKDRLRAAGSAGRAVFTITDASVIEVELPIQGGISGAFTTQPAQQYNLSIAAKLQVFASNPETALEANANVQRSQGVLQGITPNQRDQTWYDMTKAALGDFDAKMESNIRSTFGPFIVP